MVTLSPAQRRLSHRRTGTLKLAHGQVQTPAFVPLATRGVVKTATAEEVAAVGYEMILGNTFHLFLAPGAELAEFLVRPEPLRVLCALCVPDPSHADHS